METRKQLGSNRQVKKSVPSPSESPTPKRVPVQAVRKGKISTLKHSQRKGLQDTHIHLRTMYGIGDTFFQIPLIKEIARHYEGVWVSTVFPEALWEMPQNVKIIPAMGVTIRTQRKFLHGRHDQDWFEPNILRIDKLPSGVRKVGLKYRARDCVSNGRTVYQSFMNFMKQDDVKFDEDTPLDFSLGIRSSWIKAANEVRRRTGITGRFAIARSVTYRTECMFLQRNCEHKYLQMATDHLRLRGIPVIEVADVDGKAEFFVESPLVGTTAKFIKGELSLPVLMALVKMASVTVTPSGMMFHMCQLLRSNCVVLFGGMHDNTFFEDPSFSTPTVKYVKPDPFCNCWLSNCTTCNKVLNPEEIFDSIDSLIG
jgi:hypothetical protein